MHVPRFLQDFLNFIREQGVVGLAIGLVLGVAAKSVVD
jgi:large-conductance mechanosensitive channel